MINFNQMIDNFLKRERRSKGIGKYYPSEAGICLRKVWYSYKFPQEIESNLLKIFEIGNMVHDFVVEVLKSEKNPHVELLKSEFPFKAKVDDFVISGRIDDLILLKTNGTKILVEVKSTGDIGYINEPAPHNVAQLQLYLHYLKVKDGILLYVDKKNLQSRVFNIKYDEKIANETINRFKKLHQHLVNNTLPDPEGRIFPEMNWMCRYCEYRDKCYEATPARVLP